jgi:hypothetical protein
MFGIDNNAFGIVSQDPEALKSQSNTVRLQKGKRVRVKGSINKIEIPTYATLESAYWTRLTVRDHEVRRAGEETRISQVFGGVFNPVKLKVEVEVNGQTLSLEDLIVQFVLDAAQGKSRDQVMKDIEETGILSKFKDGMPLMFQQMGASENGFAHAIEVFKTAGAVDDMKSVKNNPRFHTCYDMKDKQGLEVVSFELGSAKREESKTGQGFVDIVDAVVSNLIRVLAHKSSAKILRQQIEEQASSLSQADIKSQQARINSEVEMSRQYANVWAGASRQKNATSTGDYVTIDKYNATNAPCGRWTVATANGNIDLDVWSNSNKQPVNAPVTASVDTTKAPF